MVRMAGNRPGRSQSILNRVELTEYSTAAAPAALTPPAVEIGTPGAFAGTQPATRGVLQWLLEGSGRDWAAPLLDVLLSAAAVLLALGGWQAARQYAAGSSAVLLLVPVLTPALLYRRGAYRRRLRLIAIDEFGDALAAVTAAIMAAVTLGLLLNGRVADEGLWLRAWLYVLGAVAASHVALAQLQQRVRARGVTGRPAIIVGAGVVGELIARRLAGSPEYGLRAVGFLDDDVHLIPGTQHSELPVLGRIESMADVVRQTGVRDLILAFSTSNDARLSRLVDSCRDLGVEVSVVPRLFDTINQRISYDSLGGLPLLRFDGVDPSGVPFVIKHVVDRIVAALALVLLSPLLLCIAAAVRILSPGPIIFRQRRVGRDGREFDLLKFRTMREPREVNAGEIDERILQLVRNGTAPGGVEGADRRTPLGRLLRRTSLDELPQLFNVLRGEMSLVGPRPERPELVALFGESVPRYGDRHRVKSGITGWAQVHGLRGQTSLQDRVEWDNYYIAHWSPYLDLKIVALTLRELARGGQ